MSLVLTRKLDEQVEALINGVKVLVTVTRITARDVRLAFDAPKDVRILRGEIARKPAA